MSEESANQLPEEVITKFDMPSPEVSAVDTALLSLVRAASAVASFNMRQLNLASARMEEYEKSMEESVAGVTIPDMAKVRMDRGLSIVTKVADTVKMMLSDYTTGRIDDDYSIQLKSDAAALQQPAAGNTVPTDIKEQQQ